MNGGDLSGKCILIVEDEYLLAEIAAEHVIDAGGNVVGPFPDCASALATIGVRRIDAAMLDVQLNRETVYPVAEELRLRRIPYIFVTSLSRTELRKDFERDPHLQKPYMSKALTAAVAVLVT